ncbi:MAG TPA: ATP-binding protein [Kofleriaceae bacterium]|nr:ATP-binding protein [Kofleriaceae bacterium]
MDLLELAERTAALITAVDAAGRVLLVNARGEEVCGIGRDAAVGRPWVEVFVRPEERAAAADQLAQARSSRGSGRFTAALSPEGGGPARSICWHLTEVSPDALCATGIDVTGDEEAAARCRRSERIAALGTMTAGLAHELRNPLNAAHLQLDLARRRLVKRGDGNGALDAVEIASAEVSRLGQLVDEFLVFARPCALQLSRGDLRALTELTADRLRDEASARSVAVVVEAGEPVYAEFDEPRLSQALHNLVLNAIEATGAGGRVRLALEAGDRVATILVEDSGPGLPAGAPVFEPFYTTKASGTGLGLAIAHRVACDHGGSIAVDSTPGLTRFALSVPTV